MTTPPTDPDIARSDRRWMQAALTLAARGLGQVWPNPAVGCILVQPGSPERVVGRGWTQPGGRPHAETDALARAGADAKGATAYVTLEPCSHTGETPPCADALVAAGVGRVVVAIQDPDDRVSGRGVQRLREAGIPVAVGCEAIAARRLNAGFLSRIERGRPWVALKTATSLDGRIATATGKSQWITGPEARARGHLLRARFDAILTGAGTVRADNPRLTCRLPGLEDRSPLPVVMRGGEPLPADGHLMTGGLTRFFGDGERPDPAAVLTELAASGITRLLIEAGAGIAAAFFNHNLVDEVHWFRAPTIIGADGLAAIGDMGHDNPGELTDFEAVQRYAVGVDTYEVLRRKAAGLDN